MPFGKEKCEKREEGERRSQLVNHDYLIKRNLINESDLSPLISRELVFIYFWIS